MPKSAALKKSTSSSTANKKAAKTAQPDLKVVNPISKNVKAKTVTKKTTKTATKTTKSVARPITKKTEAAKPVAKKAAPKKVAAKKTVAKKAPAGKTAAKAKAAPIVKVTPEEIPAAPATKTKKSVARPINVPPGFNRAARINSIVKKRAQSKPTKNTGFKVGCHVVYPTHGVGTIIAEEVQEIGGMTLKMFVIEFVKDKMTLRVPVQRAQASGLRHVSGSEEIRKMFDTLKSKAKTSRGMWSRRAQEYDAKINSGDVTMIAEVVRDLHQNVDQAERSYSERMIYESAFNRLAGELSASESVEYDSAGDRLLKLLRAKKVA